MEARNKFAMLQNFHATNCGMLKLDPVRNNQLTKQIESVQGRAVQWIINNWNYDVSSEQIANELQLQSLSERRELARLKLFHSIYRG